MLKPSMKLDFQIEESYHILRQLAVHINDC